jgi:transposase
MSAGQREVLESLAQSQSGAHREVVRAKALLMAADRMANTAIAASLSVSPASVKSWRGRFAEEGLAKLGQVREGGGRKPSTPQSTIDEIVDLTQNHRPKGQTHWSCWTMAAAAGVLNSTVQLGGTRAGSNRIGSRCSNCLTTRTLRRNWSMSSGST